MKLSHMTAFFVGAFLLVFWFVYVTGVKPEISYQKANRQYSVALTNACVDALNGIDKSTETIFAESSSREKALTSFYKSLADNLNIDVNVNESLLKSKVPFVILVDNDGFYVYYSAGFDEYMSAFTTGSSETIDYTQALTGLNPYTDEVDGCTVRFYLNNICEVITSSGDVYKGSREELKCILNKPFLSTEEAFEEAKNYAVIGCLEDELNFLLNTQDSTIVNNVLTGYEVSLPQTTLEDWSRMLARPSVISFVQGDITQSNMKVLNIFAYSGSELIKPRLYYSDGGLYYPFNESEGINFGTMKEMAEEGNNPSQEALWEN